ncbi:MAG: DUF4129 domain-containing protein [Thermodesulfobacteriota bacterium]
MSAGARPYWPVAALRASFVLMELCWAAAAFISLAPLTGLPSGPGAPLVVWLYLPALALGKWNDKAARRPRVRLALETAGGLTALIFILKAMFMKDWAWSDPGWVLQGLPGLAGGGMAPWPAVLTAGAGVLIWLRGRQAGSLRLDAGSLATGFQMGVVGLTLAVATAALAGVRTAPAPGLVAGFFFSGLAGLALARLLDLGEKKPGADLYAWVAVLPVAPILVLAAGLAAWMLLDRSALLFLAQPLLWLWDLFVRLLDYLAGLIEPGPMSALPVPTVEIEQAEKEAFKDLLDFGWARTVGRFLFLVATAVMVLRALLRLVQDLLRWLRRRWDFAVAVSVEPLETGLLEDLLALLAVVHGAARRLFRLVLGFFRPGTNREGETETVKLLYRRLLRWGALKGRPRRPDQSPYEYLAALGPLLGDKAGFGGAMTELYVQVRYGPPEPVATPAAEMRRLWRDFKKRRFRKRKVRS